MKTLLLFSIFCTALITTPISAQEQYLYVSDAAGFNSGFFQIVRFDPNGENPIVFIEDNLDWPQDILFLEDQEVVLISNLNTGRITKYNANTGEFIEDFAVDSGGPTRVRIGPDGFIYTLQWTTNGIVQKYATDGTPMGDFTNTGVTQSIGMDWDEDGHLYVSSYGGGTIREFDENGNDMGLFVDSGLSGPTNVEIVDGTMYVLDWNDGKVYRFDVATATALGEFITGLTNPEGIAFLPNGDLLIGDNGSNSVRRFNGAGVDLGDYTTGGNLVTPNAVVLRDASFLAVPDNSVSKILVSPTIGTRFNLETTILTTISTIQVYDLNGRMIETFTPQQSTSWNAQHQQEGVYFIVITNHNGTKHSEKVIVKK